MAVGRKTGGRRKGTPNRKTAAKVVEIEAFGVTALDYMLQVMRDTNAVADRRDEMAKAAAPYELIDGHLSQRRRLRRRQPVDRRHRISAAEKGPHEIRHVGAANLGELHQDLVGGHHGDLGGVLRELRDAGRKVKYLKPLPGKAGSGLRSAAPHHAALRSDLPLRLSGLTMRYTRSQSACAVPATSPRYWASGLSSAGNCGGMSGQKCPTSLPLAMVDAIVGHPDPYPTCEPEWAKDGAMTIAMRWLDPRKVSRRKAEQSLYGGPRRLLFSPHRNHPITTSRASHRP
jgi:hypothetical protein